MFQFQKIILKESWIQGMFLSQIAVQNSRRFGVPDWTPDWTTGFEPSKSPKKLAAG